MLPTWQQSSPTGWPDSSTESGDDQNPPGPAPQPRSDDMSADEDNPTQGWSESDVEAIMAWFASMDED